MAWAKKHEAAQLPYSDASFDVILSRFGHIFAPHWKLPSRRCVACSSATDGLHLLPDHRSMSLAKFLPLWVATPCPH